MLFYWVKLIFFNYTSQKTIGKPKKRRSGGPLSSILWDASFAPLWLFLYIVNTAAPSSLPERRSSKAWLACSSL
jgi:hypothetical protein